MLKKMVRRGIVTSGYFEYFYAILTKYVLVLRTSQEIRIRRVTENPFDSTY